MSVVFFIFSFLSSEINLISSKKDKIEREALRYVNEEILPMEGLEPNAEIVEINRINEEDFTHYILINHKEVEIEGRRKKDGTYQFSVK